MNWYEVDNELKLLASKCSKKPDIIIGIVRGGLIPARLLAKHLGIKDMYCLTVKKYGDERLVTNEINENLAGKHILLVEDVLESGTSLIAAKEYLESCGANVETASMYWQPHTKIQPDYYVAERTEVPVFPWD
ncbi:phosphoribosyltransferase domain-containing protein [Candidatus Parcubacteria bacterium]|nr:phosphoribosyltransferase domain-containing protein [Candidatus Parcubacteria bacterium]